MKKYIDILNEFIKEIIPAIFWGVAISLIYLYFFVVLPEIFERF